MADERLKEELKQVDPNKIRTLVDTALGKVKADLVIACADLVNVYSRELLRGQSVAIKGDRIAYVGENAEHTIGPDTNVIDATGKILIPGLIDAHTHSPPLFTVDEFLKYAMRGGTTTIITETIVPALSVGSLGIQQFLKATSNQPIKIFTTVAQVLTLSPAAQSDMLHPEKLRRLLKRKRVVGLGETPWHFILQGDERILQLYAETLISGKRLEGHSAGARGNRLVAYIASGISSCHESTTAEEVLERLRLGIHVMIREGIVRRDLEAIARIKDEPIDFRRLVLATDGVDPKHLMEHGYMESVVQKAIDLGFDPMVAIQMATINAAEHFSLDKVIGGIAPGKYADLAVIPDLRTIQAEVVVSNGQIIAQKGQVLVPPRKYSYPKSSLRSVRLPRRLEPADFQVRVQGDDTPVTVRVIHQTTDLVTKEEQLAMTPKDGLLEADVEGDILKVAFIDRTNNPGKMSVGFVKGFKMRKGAFASSHTWDLSGIIVVGTKDGDMASAVNRIIALQGGVVVYADGKVLAELPMPIAGYIPDLPIRTAIRRSEEIQQRVTDLGTSLPDVHLTLTTLTTTAIPFLRLCEAGLMDIKKGELVDLIV